MKPSGSQFSPSKPTQAGRYLWRLPEAEKPGTYVLRVEITPDPNDAKAGLVIFTDEGDRICTLAEAKDGQFRNSWQGSRAA